MQLGTAALGDRTRAVLLDARRGAVLVDDLLDGDHPDALAVLRRHAPGQLAQLAQRRPIRCSVPSRTSC